MTISFYLESKIGAMKQTLTVTANIPLPENSNSEKNSNSIFNVLPDSDPPTVLDESLKVQKVISGLAYPTSMTFVDQVDILISEKDSGMVRLVSNGTLKPNPVFAAIIEKENERGLLGISVANSTDKLKTLFLYFTESDNNEVRNRVYKFNWDSIAKFSDGTLLLDLPGEPGPNHDG